MTKDEVIDLIRDAGFGFLATMENNQPRVRPMMPYLTDEGELLLALLPRSRSLPQLKANPKIEVCFVDRKMWYCRITGKAQISGNFEKKSLLFNNIPMLRQYFSGPEDKNLNFVEISIENIEAMTPHSKEPEKFNQKDIKS